MNIIKEKLHIEFAKRSPPAAIAFIVCTIGLIYYKLVDSIPNLLYYPPLITMIIGNIFRIFAAREIYLKKSRSDSIISKLHFGTVILNSIAFGIILTSCFWLVPVNDPNLAFAFLLFCGIAAGSVSSLSLYPIAQQIFIFNALMIPALAILTRAVISKQNFIITLGIVLVGFIFFIVRTSIIYYQTVITMYKLENDLTIEKNKLEKSISELLLSQQETQVQKSRADHLTKLAAVGEISRALAHEINNPLTIIKGHISKIKDIAIKENTDLKDRFEASTTKIDRAIERITSIIYGLKLIAHDKPDEKRPVTVASFNLVAENLSELYKDRMDQQKIHFDIKSIPRHSIQIDISQLTQVFILLVDNAVHALNNVPDPKIIIHAIVEDPNYIKITVADNGKGILPENIDNIFMPFFTTREIGSGSGLGLNMAKGIIEQMNGTLTLEKPINNTTFAIRLPIYTDSK